MKSFIKVELVRGNTRVVEVEHSASTYTLEKRIKQALKDSGIRNRKLIQWDFCKADGELLHPNG